VVLLSAAERRVLMGGLAGASIFGPEIVHLPSTSVMSCLAALTRVQFSRSIIRALVFEDRSPPEGNVTGELDRDLVFLSVLINNSGMVVDGLAFFFPDILPMAEGL
jgi:hypothetical protein